MEIFLPFSYSYMVNAMWISSLVGGVCAFLSAYLILKGWSLIGDALSHSIVPGVAVAYIVGFPFSLGAFVAGGLATGAMLLLNHRTNLKQDAIIGLIFTGFFGLGLFIVSLFPMSVSIQTIIMGNILAISLNDMFQLVLIATVSLLLLITKWRELMLVFFDEKYSHSIGINPVPLKIMFFLVLSASCVAAMQTVGAFLVIAMVVTPGASAYLLTDRFSKLIILSVLIGSITSFLGAYLSFFIDGATGGVIVTLQTVVFLIVFLFAPKYGYFSGSNIVSRSNIVTVREE